MDYASMGQSIARVGVLAIGTPALIVLVLVLIFLSVRNPKVFRLRLIGLHYEGFDPNPKKEPPSKQDVPPAQKEGVPAVKAKP